MVSPPNKKNTQLSCTIDTHVSVVWTVPFILMVMFIVSYWYDFNPFVVKVALVWCVLHISPTLYLHYQYYRKNKGEEYRIFSDRIVRYKAGKKQEFFTKDILLVTVHLSPALYKGSHFHFLGIEAYYYACVFLKDGEKLLLTCLLDPKLDETLKTLEGVPLKERKSF